MKSESNALLKLSVIHSLLRETQKKTHSDYKIFAFRNYRKY